MRKNVGTFDAYLRITFGLVALGLASSRRISGSSSTLLTLVGAMKVAEGITRFCPALWALGLSTREKDILRAEEQVVPGVVSVRETALGEIEGRRTGFRETGSRETVAGAKPWAPGWVGLDPEESID